MLKPRYRGRSQTAPTDLFVASPSCFQKGTTNEARMEPNHSQCSDRRYPRNRTAATSAADARGSSGAGAKDRATNSAEAAPGGGSLQECANSEGNSRESIHGDDGILCGFTRSELRVLPRFAESGKLGSL